MVKLPSGNLQYSQGHKHHKFCNSFDQILSKYLLLSEARIDTKLQDDMGDNKVFNALLTIKKISHINRRNMAIATAMRSMTNEVNERFLKTLGRR